MIFHEIYSAYYNAVADLLTHLLAGERSERVLSELVRKHAFAESTLSLLPALKSGRWQLVDGDLSPVLRHTPTMPQTEMERRFLRAVADDPRVRLFDVDFGFLADVPPLFTQEDYVIYDKYSDGDPYEDEGYIARFRFLLSAIREARPVTLTLRSRRGTLLRESCVPVRLEYSEKDDKFRLLTRGCRLLRTVNLGRLCEASPYEGPPTDFLARPRSEARRETLTLRVADERNAPERVMLHFAHFEKEAEREDERHYLLRITYDTEDETELLVRVLSFGPRVEVVAPEGFRTLIRERLIKQKSCGLK